MESQSLDNTNDSSVDVAAAQDTPIPGLSGSGDIKLMDRQSMIIYDFLVK